MGVTAMFDIALDEWSNGPQKSTVMSRMYGCVRLVSMQLLYPRIRSNSFCLVDGRLGDTPLSDAAAPSGSRLWHSYLGVESAPVASEAACSLGGSRENRG